MKLVILLEIILQNHCVFASSRQLSPMSCGSLSPDPHTPRFFCLPLSMNGREKRFSGEGKKLLPFLLFVSLCCPDGVLQSCPSSWPLLTSCKTPFFLQEQIQVIPESFCFNNKEYFYTEHEPVGKGLGTETCLQI